MKEYTNGYNHNPKLWKSIDGKTWQIVEDNEVANPGEKFSFNNVITTGTSIVSQVVGSRAGGPATCEYVRSNNTWRSTDPSGIYGSEPPVSFTGMVHHQILPEIIYTGYYVVNGVTKGAIWLRQPN